MMRIINMNKKVISFILSVFMVIGMVPCGVIHSHAEGSATIEIDLQLKAVDTEGNEIECQLDVFHSESYYWVGTESCGYDSYIIANIGENTLSRWDLFPLGYMRPTEDITFTCDENGNITVTSGNAAVEVTDTMTYIVVTLQEDNRPTVDVNLQLKAVDTEGNEIEGQLDVFHVESNIFVGTAACGYEDAVSLKVGENTLEDWDSYPEGYLCPEGNITFTCDENGIITITSGNATVEVTDTITYIVVTLQVDTTVRVNLKLKAVNSDGDEIDGMLDVVHAESGNWIGTVSCGYDQAVSLVIGENTLSGWDYYPDGYVRPTEGIKFTCDENGKITVTSGNATVEVIDTVTYIVVTLQVDKTVEVNLKLKAVNSEGDEIDGDMDAVHTESGILVGTESFGYDSLHCNMGENTVSNWYLYFDGYLCPTEDIKFTCDENGNITVTSGNATVEVSDTVTYIVVTLQADDGSSSVGSGGSAESCTHENMSEWYPWNDTQHYKYCTDCGSGDSYVYEDHKGGTATCNSYAVCEDCGSDYGELSDTHGEMSAWYPWDDTQHYKYCTDCGLEESFIYGDHKGGTATCSTLAVCDDCGQDYGELGDTHGEMSAWTPYSDTQHYKYCTDCGSEESFIYGDHKGGTATCSTLAVCDDCGQDYGELSDVHSGLSEWISLGVTQHYRYCLDCGRGEAIEYGDHKGGTATCSTLAVCEVCGQDYGDYSDVHGEMSEWAYFDSDRHFKSCTDCGLEESFIYGDHKGGTATCTTKAVCEDCGQDYGDYSDVHSEMSEWITYSRTQHYKYCTDCGRGDSYVYEDHKGGTATCNSYTICEDCGSYYGELSDTHGEMSEWISDSPTQHFRYCLDCGRGASREYEDHKGGTATCKSKAVCEDCGSPYGETNDNHVELSDWVYDDETHWKTCSCGDTVEQGKHSDDDGDGFCDVCGGGSFTLGDVNGDGKVNLDDVVALLRHVSKAVVITDPKSLAAAEIVEDGILNIDDVVRLLRYVSKAVPSLRP